VGISNHPGMQYTGNSVVSRVCFHNLLLIPDQGIRLKPFCMSSNAAASVTTTSQIWEPMWQLELWK